MIKIENVNVYGFEAAIRGMRNPMNSWEKSDSCFDCCIDTRCMDLCGYSNKVGTCEKWHIKLGENDIALMKQLVKAGTDHRKFMRFITVACDITAPLYWWKEYSTYKVGTVANSCSTMHMVHKKEFTLDDFSHEHLFNGEDKGTAFLKDFEYTLAALNTARDLYFQTKDKKYWWQMIQLLPSSYNQRRTLMLNYEVLRSMYHARKNHKLDEWRALCEWVETLPYSELITEV